MHTTDPIPGAAMQVAEALVKSRRCTPFTEEVAEFWGEKARILADIHGISRELDELCDRTTPPSERAGHRHFDHKREANNIRDPRYQGDLPRWPSLAVRLAVLAAARSFDPLGGTGVLAFSPHRSEASFFRARLHELYELAAACEAKSFELLAGLLAISLPSLRRDAVPDATLIARGLPDEEPVPNY